MGSFSYWIEKLEEHYLRKTGMQFYPGTLNVRLEERYSLPECVIRLEASEYGGTVSVSIVPCLIRVAQARDGRRAFLLRTDANEEGRGHHPRTVVRDRVRRAAARFLRSSRRRCSGD
jgi:riboflavin kinase